jgi:hypothetical protein
MSRMIRIHSSSVRTAPPLLCRLWGHKLDEEASYFYYVDYCERCNRHVSDTGRRERFKTRLWLLRTRIRDAVRRIVRCMRPCPDCGRRFGRCDSSAEHIPF